jgi:hypothetical protein
MRYSLLASADSNKTPNRVYPNCDINKAKYHIEKRSRVEYKVGYSANSRNSLRVINTMLTVNLEEFYYIQ